MSSESYELDALLNADDVMWRNITNQALTEAFGEGATELSNMVADCLIMGKNSNYEQNILRYLAENPTWSYEQAEKQALIDSALQIAEASGGGLISGGTMGSGVSIVQNVSNQVKSNATQAEVAESLRSKGISLQKVDGIAEAVTARLNHQELTRTQRNLLSSALNSSAVRDTISKLINNKKSTPEKQKITSKPQKVTTQAQNTLAKSINHGTIKLGLTEADTKGIYDYMSAKSYVVNEKLRTGLPLTDEDQTFVNSLDAALKKMPTYQGHLKRSLIFETDEDVQAFIQMYTEGEVMKYDQYISTTQGGTYNLDGQVQILIRNAKRGKDISILNPNETEVLYERGMTFRVVSVRKVGSKYYLLMEESDE